MSEIEETLAWQLKALKIPFEREVKLIPDRRFRFDFVFERVKLAVEVDGGVWTSGRHTRGKGWEADAEKSALAAALGYRVIHFSGPQVNRGEAFTMIEACLDGSRG